MRPGTYQGELTAGTYTLRAEASGYLSVVRALTIRPDAVTRIPDLRLTPVGEATTIPGIGASTLNAGAWTISVPSAALGRFTELSVTDIGAQAMPAVARWAMAWLLPCNSVRWRDSRRAPSP